MAILLPTNLNLPASAFLDKRTGLAESVSDLRDWDFDAYPIPVGFEVCVDGNWYAYQGQNVDISTLTGYFRERGGINVVQEEGSSETDVMSQAAVTNSLYSLNNLIQQIIERFGVVFELELVDVVDSSGETVTNGDGLFESGTSVTPYFAWKAYYNGEALVPGRENNGTNTYGVSVSYVELLNNNQWSSSTSASGTIVYPSSSDEDQYVTKFQAANPITRDTKYTVSLYYGSGVSQLIASIEISYTFVDRKYWGYTNSTETDTTKLLEAFLSESSSSGAINKIIGSELSQSRELGLTTFDCSSEDEGVYLVYAVPSEIYGDEEDLVRVLVGNIETNTYDVWTGTSGNGTINYRVVLFNVAQRGILNVEIKNYE